MVFLNLVLIRPPDYKLFKPTPINPGANYFAVYQANSQHPNLIDIYLADENDKQVYVGSYADVYTNHYHWYEYNQGYLYIIKRIGNSEISKDWTDELWQISLSATEKLIYSGQGIDFRVAPSNNQVAIKETDNLYIIRLDTGEKQTFKQSQLGSVNPASSFELLGWSQDNQYFWSKSLFDEPYFLRIDVNQSKIQKYAMDIRVYDYVLNYNTGGLVYSNYPRFYGVEEQDAFKKSGQFITLKYLNLLTGNFSDISQAQVWEFKPAWIDNQTIEYNNPETGERVQYVITIN